MTFPNLRATTHVEIRFDGTTWVDVGADGAGHVLTQAISITTGKQDETTEAEPAEVTIVLDNITGAYTPGHPLSPHFPNVVLGIALRIRVGDDVRFTGEVWEWDLSFPYGDLADDDVEPIDLDDPEANRGESRVRVVAAGLLRRTGDDDTPLDPALARESAREPAVMACWPLAGLGQDVTRAPSVVGGTSATIRPTTTLAFDVEWSADQAAPGLGAMPTVRAEQSGVGFTGQVEGATEPFGWSMWGRASGDEIASQFTMWVDTESTKWLLWVLWETPILDVLTIIVQARDVDNNLVADLANTNDIAFDDRWHQLAAIVAQDGSDADLTVLLDGVQVPMTLGSGSLNGLAVGTPRQTRPTGSITSPAGRGMSIGYPTVLTGSVATLTTAIQSLHTAGRGHAGEPAGRRIERLCDEEDVPLATIGDLDETELLGAQAPRQLLALLREAELADLGMLTDGSAVADEPALTYRTRESLYNQTPALDLDAGPPFGQIVNPFSPVLDDNGIVNELELSRLRGGSVTGAVTSGPKSTARPPAGAGRKPRQLALNLAADGQLPDQLGWRLHLGTWPDSRYPSASPALSQVPALIPAWVGLRFGDLVRIVGLPPQHPPGGVELLALGWAETIQPHRWDVEVNTSSAGPYTVGVFADDEEEPGPAEPKRYSPFDARVAAPFEVGTDTALSVADRTGNDPWSQAADFPYDVRARGVRLRVTAVGAPQPPFVLSSIPAAAGANSRGLTWDGTALWLADQVATAIHRVDPADGTVLDTLSVAPDEPFGLAWNGTALWYVHNGGNIRRIDPSTGTILESFASPGGFPRGLTWDGQFLWHSDAGTNLIYRLDPSSGNVLQSFAGPTTTPADMAWDGAALWVAGRAPNPTVLYRVNPSNGALMSSFLAPGAGPWGLAWDGATLWNADTDSELVFRISPLPTQQLTVDQQPVNGVTGVTVQPGERVELWQPARYAL